MSLYLIENELQSGANVGRKLQRHWLRINSKEQRKKKGLERPIQFKADMKIRIELTS